MEHCRREQPWGKLVKVGSSETVLLSSRECTVGRKKGCYLSFPACKLVSGEHCKIVNDEGSGQVWLEDTSTNGTVINMSKLVKRQTHMLQNGDVIYFVYRKHEPEQNIAYVYQSIKEQEDTERSASSPHPVAVSELSLSVEPVLLPTAPVVPSQEEAQPSTSTSHFCIHKPSSSDASGRFSAITVFTGKDYNASVPHTSTAEAAAATEGSAGNLLPAPAAKGTKADKMEESLTCVICQDLLHDCVSLQPCMHVFCAACYSGWMERSSLCPTCRCPVERIRKNHVLNNLVEAYLLQHPEKCRSQEDLKSMDSRNKITQDMLQPKVERSFSDEDGSSDYLFEISDNDSDSSDLSQPLVMCRQCPGYRGDVSQVPAEEGAARASGEQPSTSSDVPSAPQEYCCPPQGFHLICTCCLQPMPDRQAERSDQQPIAQQCVLCQRPFCHMYWGCQRIGCQGCLAPFRDLNLMDKCLDGVLNNNNYESDVLKNYLSSRGKTWKDLLHQSLQGLQQGDYSLTVWFNFLSDRRISANTILCFGCGLRAFRELAYKYRENIPPSELPAAVTSRPDCYWGRNCRTQVKAHHATKFNHICEQTRFKC
uniref:E3 ubiquitin-protein ligase CHFR n=1 Tax=Salarias fasciatus TaxID=181472 RepID=A0A672J037_SALFA